MKIKKGWLLTAIAALIILFVAKSNFYVMNLMKFFVNNFATGRSDFKVVLFLTFLTLMSIILSLTVNFPIIRLPSYMRKTRLVPLLLFGLLLLGYIIGIYSYVYYVEEFDLDYKGYYLSIYEGKLSSTQFYHIHNTKGVLTKWSEIFNLPLHQTYDEGLFYKNIMPNEFVNFFFILLPIMFLLIIVCLLKLNEDLAKNKFKPFYLTIYILSGLSSIKNVIDGSLFNAEALFWFSVFSVMLGFLYLKKEFIPVIFLKWIFGTTAIVYLLILPFYILFWINWNYLLGRYLLFSLFLYWLFLTFKFISEKNISKLIIFFLSYILLVLLIALTFSNSFVHYALNAELQMSMPIKQGADAYLYIPSGQNPELCAEILYSQEDFSLCHFKVQQNTTILHLLNKNSQLPVNYNPLLIDQVSCSANSTRITYGNILLINGSMPQFINTTIMQINFTRNSAQPALQGKYSSYNYSGTYFGCTPSFLEALYRTFNAHGLKAFIVK